MLFTLVAGFTPHNRWHGVHFVFPCPPPSYCAAGLTRVDGLLAIYSAWNMCGVMENKPCSIPLMLHALAALPPR